MPKTGPTTVAKRSLIWLGIIFIALGAILAGGKMFDDATLKPKLALDLEGGTEMILAPQVQGGAEITDEQLQQAVSIIRKRVDGSGVSEAQISTQSGQNVVVDLPGTPDKRTRELIQASANMEFRPVLKAAPGQATPKQQRTPEKKLPHPSEEPKSASDLSWITADLLQKFEAKDCTAKGGSPGARQVPNDEPMVACQPATEDRPATKYILGPVEVPGTDIASASYGLTQSATGATLNQWAVNIEFNSEGTEKFREVTKRLMKYQGTVRNQFAIVLDNKVISAPTTNQVIPDGQAQITGNFTEKSSAALAEQLKYGALPISFDIQSERQISATLGESQLQMGLIAGLIGLVLVAIYSFFQYRVLGAVTIASLVVAGVLTYLAIVILGWSQNYRLSLAGVAGLIVAIGQTADSFIVYFERIRDELREGKGVVSAIETGWKRAKPTVLASKAVNLLAAIVLYFVAVGSVKGFAFTLGLTAIADLIVVFMFTHPTLRLLAQTKFFGRGHKLSGLNSAQHGAVPLYRGAGRISLPTERTKSQAAGKNTGAAGEAQRRQTIAERRAAEREAEKQGSLSGSSKGPGEENDS